MVLADRCFGANSVFDDVSDSSYVWPQVFAMVDTVRDEEAPIMKLCTKRVEGINEPVKLISMAGFAVGARTDNVYAWALDYSDPMVDE